MSRGLDPSREIARRTALKGLGAAAMVVLGGSRLVAASRQPFFQRVKLPIGLQLYTLGETAGRDLDATFASVAAIGYREIELPNLLGRQPAEIAAAAARAGLAITSVHLPLLATGGAGLTLGSEPDRIADVLGVLKARWVVAPIALLPSSMRPAPKESMQSAISRAFVAAGADIWKKTAALLNQQARALKSADIRVAYHNHNIEFAPIGATSGWEILSLESDRSLVSFEVDIGWVAAAGLDPVRFLDSIRGRVSHLHIKDIAPGNEPNYLIAMKPTEVGAGLQPWPRILIAAYRAGARHFFVEQEPPFSIPRIEAARRSYVYLATLQA